MKESQGWFCDSLKTNKNHPVILLVFLPNLHTLFRSQVQFGRQLDIIKAVPFVLQAHHAVDAVVNIIGTGTLKYLNNKNKNGQGIIPSPFVVYS